MILLSTEIGLGFLITQNVSVSSGTNERQTSTAFT